MYFATSSRDGRAIHAIRPAARHFGATFSSTISISVRNSTSCADISRLIRARCGLFFAILIASGGKKQADDDAAISSHRTAYNRAMAACLQGRGYTVN